MWAQPFVRLSFEGERPERKGHFTRGSGARVVKEIRRASHYTGWEFCIVKTSRAAAFQTCHLFPSFTRFRFLPFSIPWSCFPTRHRPTKTNHHTVTMSTISNSPYLPLFTFTLCNEFVGTILNLFSF